MDADKSINDDLTMVIHLNMISDKVTRDKFIETVNEGFKTASHGKATEAQKIRLRVSFQIHLKKVIRFVWNTLLVQD